MDEKTTMLIEQLAAKLGTTAEYLWKVLVKQAAIDAVYSGLWIIATVIFGCYLYWQHKRNCVVKSRRGVNRTAYGSIGFTGEGDGSTEAMVVGVLIFICLFFYSIACINDAVNGIFNPEYWALQEILETVK